MSNTLDYEGHYKALGIAPNATAEEVKRAFRALARDLHPDRNQGRDTTAAFQRVSAAYEVLKDPKKRADYNAEGARRMRDGAGSSSAPRSSAHGSSAPGSSPPGTKGAARSSSTASGPRRSQAELQMCASCGCLSAQPRATYFTVVRGFVTIAKVSRKGGIYCPRCAFRIGLKHNIFNWLLGWWALPMGPPRTLEATFTNMVGGYKPSADNVNLLYRQAVGFYFAGHPKIAFGIVEDALRLSPSLAMRDELLSLRRQMGSDRPGPRLRNEWQLTKNPYFWGQLLPVLVIILFLLKVIFSSVNVEFFDFSYLTDPITSQLEQLWAPGDSSEAGFIPHQVVIDRLPVYAAPNTSAELVGQLRLDGQVMVSDEVAIGGWAAIDLPDGSFGYVAKSGLRPLAQ